MNNRMNKRIWKKIYRQCRLWIQARELTYDPMPYKAENKETFAWVDWFVGDYFIMAFIGPCTRKITISRRGDFTNEVKVRFNA